MELLPLLLRPEKKALTIGLLAFLTFGVVVPFLAVLVVSFGPSEWIYRYIAPAKPYQDFLFIPVGAITAWQSTRAPVANALVVGVIGGLAVLAFGFLSGASPHLGPVAHVLYYFVVPVGLCFLGGFSVSLLWRNHAL